MKHLIRFASIALACGLLVCLAGCSCSSTQQEAQKPVPAETDEGTTIDLDGGWVMYAESNLLVVLDENATTGYSWTSAIEGSTLALYTEKIHQRRRGVSDRGREPRRRGRQPSVLLQGDGRR